MVSPSHLRPSGSVSAPSASLLRFLRTQSDGCISSFPRCRNNQGRCFSAQRQLSIGDVQRGSRLRDRSALSNQTSGANASFLRPLTPTPLRPRPLFNPVNSKSQSVRSFSSSPKKSRNLLRRLLGLHRQPPHEKLRHDDLPVNPGAEDGYEGNMFNIGRGLAAKATNEPRLRCTELDENGNVTLVNGEFRKSELIAKVCIYTLHFGT